VRLEHLLSGQDEMILWSFSLICGSRLCFLL